MDRLETNYIYLTYFFCSLFTFQYGQIRNRNVIQLQQKQKSIYIPVWIDQKQEQVQEVQQVQHHLHSSMDRLETCCMTVSMIHRLVFTFQYGQIRNKKQKASKQSSIQIYIPVWIDQKPKDLEATGLNKLNLHSSMDRLETINYF